MKHVINYFLKGEVAEVGDGVEGFAKGDKVYGSIPNGAYAEKLVVDASAVHHLPKVFFLF